MCVIHDRISLRASLIPEAASAEPSMPFEPRHQSSLLRFRVSSSRLGVGACMFSTWLQEMGACCQSSRTT